MNHSVMLHWVYCTDSSYNATLWIVIFHGCYSATCGFCIENGGVNNQRFNGKQIKDSDKTPYLKSSSAATRASCRVIPAPITRTLSLSLQWSTLACPIRKVSWVVQITAVSAWLVGMKHVSCGLVLIFKTDFIHITQTTLELTMMLSLPNAKIIGVCHYT